MTRRDMEHRTKRFALSVINLVAELPVRRPISDVLGRQLPRAGTSVGANYREASRAESRDDFIHKIGIAEKESSECGYWLELLAESGYADPVICGPLRQESDEVLAILTASGRTAKARRRRARRR